jgi:hypothetical protein
MNLKQRALTKTMLKACPKVTKCFIDFASAKKLDFERKYPWEASPMEKFIKRENINIFKQRLTAPVDEAQRQTLLKLLAEEEAKFQQLNEGHEPKKPKQSD